MATGVRGRAASLPPSVRSEVDTRGRSNSVSGLQSKKEQQSLVPGSFASSGGRTPGLTPEYRTEPAKPQPAGYFAAATTTRVAIPPPGSAATARATSTPPRIADAAATTTRVASATTGADAAARSSTTMVVPGLLRQVATRSAILDRIGGIAQLASAKETAQHKFMQGVLAKHLNKGVSNQVFTNSVLVALKMVQNGVNNKNGNISKNIMMGCYGKCDENIVEMILADTELTAFVVIKMLWVGVSGVFHLPVKKIILVMQKKCKNH
jgi:hypothetical protein